MADEIRRVRTQAERAGDDHTWHPGGICVNTVPGLLHGEPLNCTLPAGHEGWHRNDHGTVWTMPGPPRRRWWHRLTRRNP